MTEKMELADFLARIRNGTMFTVHFVKRTGDREERTMNARTGVKKYLAGGELPYDPVAKKLLPVYDLQIEDYRSVPLDAIIWLKYQGRTWNWDMKLNLFVSTS